MASTVDQKTYLLNKYLKPVSGDKKKKKKKHVKGTGLRIIDDDVDTSRMRPLESSELEALGMEDEDAPQIAGIVDERPEELQRMEEYSVSSKWRVVAQNDGIDSKISVEEIKRNITKMDEEDHPIFGKMYSDSEDETKNDSDLSPQRKTDSKQKSSGNMDKSKNKQIQRGSDSDLSPPRGRNRKKSVDSDISPPRKSDSKHTSVSQSNNTKNKQIHRDSDSDLSPPRSKNLKNYLSPPRQSEYKKKSGNHNDKSRTKQKHRGSDSDLSPPRNKNRKKSEGSELSPPRKTKHESRNNERSNRESPKRRLRNSSNSDVSPPRKHEQTYRDKPRKPSRWGHFGPESKDTETLPYIKSRGSISPERTNSKSKRGDDADLSPPRQRKNYDLDQSPPRKTSKPLKRDRSVDLSPPRRSKKSPEPHSKRDERTGSGRYERPGPSRSRDDRTNERRDEERRYDDKRRNDDSPPPTNKKMAKTLEGKMAGLQDAKQLRDENTEFRRREDEMYNKMSVEASGRNATTANRRLGKRETSAEKEKKRADQEKQKEMEEKYSKWGKGLKQVADQTARIEDYLHEAAKPLARHRDDVDLERSLKAQERAGDPMLDYMRGKSKEDSHIPDRPTYKGDCPPNRFNIRPGYRWDGVDRSNGYEKKYFDSKSKAKALEEEAYKWSTEDL